MNSTNKRQALFAGIALAAVAALAAAPSANGVAIPGTPGPDVHLGLDNDNADNAFIQPPGVAAKQHMEATDVLPGRGGDDLLVGNLGGDTLLGGRGSDVLIGGPERFAAPNSDVLVGEAGNDINIWAPGDGSDAFLGQDGYDTMVFAPLVTRPDGSLRLVQRLGRTLPRVDIDDAPQFGCRIVPVPASEHLGFQFLVRFEVNGVPAVTVRQKDVERVFCPSPDAGHAQVADLTARHPAFTSVSLRHLSGVAGAVLAPVH